jgi:hypothetical protein
LKDPRLKDSVSGEKGLGSINSLPNFLSCIVLEALGGKIDATISRQNEMLRDR